MRFLKGLFAACALFMFQVSAAWADIPGLPTDDNFYQYIGSFFELARTVSLSLAGISFFMVAWKYKKGEPQDKEALPKWIIAFVLMLIAAAVFTVIRTTVNM